MSEEFKSELKKMYKEYLKEKEKIRFGKISVAYAGGFHNSNDLNRRISWEDVFLNIASQGIHLHIYPTNEIDLQHDNIIIHKVLPSGELVKEISEYCYGIHLDFFSDKVSDEFIKTTTGNKVFTYLEAGLPVIINEEMKFMAEFVRINKCGVVIKEKDISNLRKILEKQNYEELLENVEKTRQKFKMSNQIKNLIKKLK